MKKIIIAFSFLSVSINFVFAQTINKIEDRGDTIYLSVDATPFHMKMNGMKDNDQESIARSKKDGASLQFFLADKSIVDSGLEQDILVKEVNKYVEDSSKYFKQHPNIKGMQIVTFIVFPGYKTPYQLTSTNDPQRQDFVNHFNRILKKDSICNKDGFCSANVLMDSTFINLEDLTQKLNNRELGLFLDKQPKNGLTLYTSNKDYLYPVQYILVLGTNGYLATESKIRHVLKSKNIE